MTYAEYLNFYHLENTEDNRENWLYNDWHHGRAYLYNGTFYSTSTGEKI